MNPSGFPISIAAATLAVAGLGVLYALHHLRIEPKRLPAATLLFWRQAIGSQQARVLSPLRFVHHKTFLLTAMTVILLALSLTADRWGRSNRSRLDVIVVDSGGETGATGVGSDSLLRTMADTARRDMNGLPGGAALIAAGPRPLLLADLGEPPAVVDRDLASMTPADGASASALALEMAAGILGDRSGTIGWYTTQNELPPGVPDEVARRVVRHCVPAADAVTITGIIFEPDPGNDTIGSLHVRLSGRSRSPVSLSAKVDGGPIATRSVSVNGETTDVRFEGLFADARTVRIELERAPGAAATHVADFRLPDRRPLTFRMNADVSEALKASLMTVGRPSAEGIIAVQVDGEPIPAGARAAIIIMESGPPIPTGVVLQFADDPATRGINLEGAVTGNGPALAAGIAPLLRAEGRMVAGLDYRTAVPTLYLSQSLVGPESDLPKHAAFPLLIRRFCDRLINRSGGQVAVAASRLAQDPLWRGPFDVPSTGVAAVYDRPPNPLREPGSDESAATASTGGAAPQPWVTILMVAALLLLSIDAVLRGARKIV